MPQGTPRALIVVVPGTDGISDPALIAELKQSEYRPDSRGGLTDLFLRANYAVAFYSQRGLAPPKSCISGNSYEQRLQAYADKCVDVSVRAQVSLRTVTSDTQKVFSALTKHPRLEQMPQIALGLSEGLYHIAQLVKEKAIQPRSIVAVGGPLEALSDAFDYQSNRKYYFHLIAAAFAECKTNNMRVEQVFLCGKTKPTPEKVNIIKELFDGDSTTINNLAARKTLFENAVKQDIQANLQLPANAITTQSVDGRILGIWSARRNTEVSLATESASEKMSSFGGGLIFIFGAEDHRVRVPKAGQCRTKLGAQSSTAPCEIIVLEGIGHGLEDASGFPTKPALDKLLAAVDSVSHPR
jgi:hypothetical protein